MPYQNDMSSLADIVGPAYAAQQAGIQNDAANQIEAAKAQVAQGTVQPEIEKAGLANLFTQAQTAQQQAQTQGTTLGNIQKAGTLGSDIAATNVGNQLKISQDQVQKLNTLGQMAGQVAGYLDGVPPAARPAAMDQILRSQGVDPQQLGPLASGDPDMLRNFSQKAVQASAAYQTQLMSETVRGDTQRDVANIGAQSREREAQTIAGGRTQAATIAAGARMAGIQQVIGQLTQKVANGTATQADRDALDYANKTQQLIKSGNPFAAQLTGTNVQSNVPNAPGSAPTGASPTVPNTQPQPQAQPTPVPDTPALQAAASQKWGNGGYDTSKYTYVMALNPATGQMDLGRIPK